MKKLIPILLLLFCTSMAYSWTEETPSAITWTEEDGGTSSTSRIFSYNVEFSSSVEFSGGSGSVTGIVEQIVAGANISISPTAGTNIVTITGTGGAGDVYKASTQTFTGGNYFVLKTTFASYAIFLDSVSVGAGYIFPYAVGTNGQILEYNSVLHIGWYHV